MMAALAGCKHHFTPSSPPPPSEAVTVRRDAADNPAWGSTMIAALTQAGQVDGYRVKQTLETAPAIKAPAPTAEIWYDDGYVVEAQQVCVEVRKKYYGPIIRKIGGRPLTPMMYVYLPKGTPPSAQTGNPPSQCAEGKEAPRL